MRGGNLQERGQLNEAIGAYEEAIKLGMDRFPRVHLYQAGSNLDLKKYDTAIQQYTKFIDKFGLERLLPVLNAQSLRRPGGCLREKGRL